MGSICLLKSNIQNIQIGMTKSPKAQLTKDSKKQKLKAQKSI